VELWYGDGVRFELLPVARHMWRSRGQRLFIATPGSNVRVAVCGAFRWPAGPFLFTHGDKNVVSALFLELLRQLGQRARRTGRRIVLVLDNGSAFTSAASLRAIHEARGWLTIFWLPKYTSEQLNPIENVWGHLKSDYFSRMLTPVRPTYPQTREVFRSAVISFLRSLRCPGALRRVLRPLEAKHL
jgi:transposase